MRLCFCVKSISAPGGGAERIVTIVASELAARGHDVSLLSFDRPDEAAFFPLHPRVRRVALGIGSTTDPANVFDTLRRIVHLRRTLQGEPPDVVIGFMHSMHIPVGLALLGTSIPFIASEHIVWRHYRTRPLQAALMLAVPFLCDRITCVSEQAKATYPRLLRNKMSVIENPIVPSNGRADVVGGASARRKLLAVGRLEPQKDNRTLIAAFASIAADLPDWDLHIVGDGAMRRRLQHQITAAGLEGRVQLRGSASDVAAEYLSAQLFVIPSRYEAYGLSLAEAIAHGLPAVGFNDCTGADLQIRSGVNGLLVEGRGNRKANLARGLKALMQDDMRRRRMSDEAMKVERKPLRDSIDHWVALIEDAVGPRMQADGSLHDNRIRNASRS